MYNTNTQKLLNSVFGFYEPEDQEEPPICLHIFLYFNLAER